MRSRSRSPTRVETVGRRRTNDITHNMDSNKNGDMANALNDMNQMMMNNMFQQGNMMVTGGMYPNMMMPGSIMAGSIMSPTGMEMMAAPGMNLIQQPQMDLSMGAQSIASGSGMDMNMMMMNPSVMGVGIYPNVTGTIAPVQEKKEIILKTCKLSPPASDYGQPPLTTRPPGCRTIFVGGLPNLIKESTVREIFECCGQIHTLRMSKKNFCHIRYDRENSVNEAVQLSGYRILLFDKTSDEDEAHGLSGWLHVDYAMSRDDQNEYERKQRQALRAQQEQLQHGNVEEDMNEEHESSSSRYRSPSPVKIQPFSNAMIIQLSEKIKNEEHFLSSLPILLSWLERGECSKKNSNQFYSMIQATNSHIKRLFNEKMQAEEELQEYKEKVKNNIDNIISQFEQVAKIFNAAMHQRVWDHFTKPQRKNIETWQKMAQELHTIKEGIRNKFHSEENDYYGRAQLAKNNQELQRLKAENESLQFQLEAYRNEVDVIKADAQKEMEKFKAQFIARQALQNSLDNKPPLPTSMEKPPPPPPLPDDLKSQVILRNPVEIGCGEAKLIGVMSAFLQVHPQGASLDYVVSYVRAQFPQASQAAVHHVLQKYADVFERSTSGVGADIEHRWAFVGFRRI